MSVRREFSPHQICALGGMPVKTKLKQSRPRMIP